MTDGAPPVEVRGLVKRYGDLVAVDDVDLTVERGDVFGYLGPNGAGKTTSLRMMLGLIRPTAGDVRVFGRDPWVSVRALEGVAGFVEAPRFYPYLDGRTNLRLLAALDGDGATRPDRGGARRRRAHAAARRTRSAATRTACASGSGIAAALLRRPRLLLLDEPATGLDPGGMRDMRRLIRRLADDGITVLLSSHLLAEVEELCNRVAIVRSGRIVYEGAARGPAAHRRRAPTACARPTTSARAAVCAAQPGIADVDAQRGRRDHVPPDGDEARSAPLSLALTEAGALILELAPRMATLEELFFELTEGEDDAGAGAERVAHAAELAEERTP